MVALVFLSSNSTAYADDHRHNIIVEKVSGKYVALDSNTFGTSTWHYLVLTAPDSNCQTSWDQDEAESYTEGDGLALTGEGTLCFRAVTILEHSVPLNLDDETRTNYGGINLDNIGDNTGPKVNDLRYYTGPGNDIDHPITLNADNIGDEGSFFIAFDEKVTIDENGGDGPRLKLNVGEDRYAYLREQQTGSARTLWYFSYYLQAGDNTADLDVIGWENNGATIADEHGNDFIASDSNLADFFSGYVAANQAVVIDTSPPVIAVSSPVGNKVSATVTDNLDSSVAFFKGRLMASGETCDSANTGTFLDYTAGTKLSLSIGFSACFHAKDAAGNSAYADSAASTAPPTITVTPSAAHSTLKREITVTASSSSPGLVASSWKHRNIAGSATCDATALHRFFESGTQKTLDNEAYNGNKVCFGVKDDKGNWGYAASGLITNIDRTPPTISVSPVSATNGVSATATSDSGGSPTLAVAVIADNVCSSSTSATFQSYTASTTLTLMAATRVCFRATDSVNNVRYVSSTPGADLVDTSVVTLDTTAPVITVTPAAAHSTPKRQIRVFASSSSSDADADSWQHKIISSSDTCNAAEMNSGTSSGRSVTLNSESYNNHKVCFGVKDTSDNWNYAVNGLITGIDRIAPTVTVTPSVAHSTPKREITVVASSSAADMDGNSWQHKIISSSDTCNAAEMNSGTSSGRAVTLNSQSHNNHKVCFGVKDTSDNWNYAASGVISGIDRTAPSIAVSSVSADNEVDASVSDNTDNSPSLRSQIISDNVCDDNTGGSFEAYTPGTALSLPIGSRACFEATDSAGNVSYAVSGVGAAPDIGVPANDDTSLPTINVRTVGSNRVSATLAGDLSNSPVLEFQIISDNVCDDSIGGSFEAYTAGTALSLPIGSRACFKVTDNNDNTVYALSAAGSRRKKRIQTQDNTEQQQSPPQQFQLEVDVLPGDTPSATDNYANGLTTMFYRIQTGEVCNHTLDHDTFDPYQEGTPLALRVSSDYYACFKSVDNDDENNVAYAVSALIVVDEIEPDPAQPPAQPPVQPIDSEDEVNDDGSNGQQPAPTPPTPTPGGDVIVAPEPEPAPDPADNNEVAKDGETDTDPEPSTPEDPGGVDILLILVGAGLLVATVVFVVVKRFADQRD